MPIPSRCLLEDVRAKRHKWAIRRVRVFSCESQHPLGARFNSILRLLASLDGDRQRLTLLEEDRESPAPRSALSTSCRYRPRPLYQASRQSKVSIWPSSMPIRASSADPLPKRTCSGTSGSVRHPSTKWCSRSNEPA